MTSETLFDDLRRDRSVETVLFTADDPDRAFRRVVYHHLAVMVLDRPTRPLFDAEIEWSIDEMTADVLEHVCEEILDAG